MMMFVYNFLDLRLKMARFETLQEQHVACTVVVVIVNA